jgi:hypothetical protein
MLGVGILTGLAGYALLYYGLTQIQGGNWSLLDLVVPGRYNPNQPRDYRPSA